MRRIRRTMLKGELPPECRACADSNDAHYHGFNNLFAHEKPALRKATSRSGKLSTFPVSFDYRLSNQCNFKCYMCSSNYSSTWEKEATQLRGDYSLPSWLREPKRSEVHKFQREVSEKELAAAIEDRSVKEIYWAGGEPLLLDAHWRNMKRIIELGIAPQVYVRYNTNLSTLRYQGLHLFDDILSHFPHYTVGASLDATGEIGEYLRTGLRWSAWEANFRESLSYVDQKKKKFMLAHTLTLPGILDLKNMIELSRAHNVPIITQLIVSGEPRIPLSPLVLPRDLLGRLIEETMSEISELRSPLCESTFSMLESLAARQEKWNVDDWRQNEASLRSGLALFLQNEKHRIGARPGKGLFDHLSTKPYIRDWLMQYI